jgi:hypothetical protein
VAAILVVLVLVLVLVQLVGVVLLVLWDMAATVVAIQVCLVAHLPLKQPL